MTPEEAKQLGQLIRTNRQRLRLSIRQLAPRVQLHPSTITRLERGDFLAPKDNTLQRLATALGIKQTELAGITARYVVPMDLPEFPRYLIAKYPELPSAAADELIRHFYKLLAVHNNSDQEQEPTLDASTITSISISSHNDEPRRSSQ